MKTQSSVQQKDEFKIKDHPFLIGGLIILTLTVIITFFVRKNKKDRIKQWLHSMGYTEVNHRTGIIMFPKITISKDKIVIKNSNLINHKEVEDKREAWEKFFQIKILEPIDENRKTIVYISK